MPGSGLAALREGEQTVDTLVWTGVGVVVGSLASALVYVFKQLENRWHDAGKERDKYKKDLDKIQTDGCSMAGCPRRARHCGGSEPPKS